MEIKNALKAPYLNFGKVILYALLYLIIIVLFVAFVGVDFLNNLINISSVFIIIIQIIFFLLAFLLTLLIIGNLSNFARGVSEKLYFNIPKLFSFESIVLGFKLLLIFVIYGIIYQLTTFVNGNFGFIITFVYLILLILFLPSIFTMVSVNNSFISGFKFNKILKNVFTKNYFVAFGLLILFLIVYSVLSVIINKLILNLSSIIGSSIVYSVILNILTFAFYLIILFLFFVSIIALFAQTFEFENSKITKNKIRR
ncbi:hypothetical protein J4216_02750 [Candidatus Woesearchaeota archaeon]|nr:hypothetical protein [Candidatus Woesearchaeota archaeon]